MPGHWAAIDRHMAGRTCRVEEMARRSGGISAQPGSEARKDSPVSQDSVCDLPLSTCRGVSSESGLGRGDCTGRGVVSESGVGLT